MKRQKAPHIRTGQRGEFLAALHLRLKGYRILERNHKCRQGEIDIIASRKGVLVFVEVRTREYGALVDPFASVNPTKVVKIVDAARWYLLRLPSPLPPCRFDLVAITSLGPRHITNHIAGAFDITTGEYVLGKRILAGRRRRRFKPGGAGRRQEGGGK
jgi:putative endonuclease